MRLPTPGRAFHIVDGSGGFWRHQPGPLTAARVRSFDSRQVDPHGGGRLPFPDPARPGSSSATQLGRERRIPFPGRKTRGNISSA